MENLAIEQYLFDVRKELDNRYNKIINLHLQLKDKEIENLELKKKLILLEKSKSNK